MQNKKMTITIVALLIIIVAAGFWGCKYLGMQPLDKTGMIYEDPQEDGHNKEAILDGPDGMSTHAFKGSKDSVEIICP